MKCVMDSAFPLRAAVLDTVAKQMQLQMRAVASTASPSLLRQHSVESLAALSFDALLAEFRDKCPDVLRLVSAACFNTTRMKKNTMRTPATVQLLICTIMGQVRFITQAYQGLPSLLTGCLLCLT